MFYIQWTSRMVLLVSTFLKLIDDPSPFGPYRWLHDAHECSLLAAVLTLLSVACDRVIATKWAEEYEESTTPKLALAFIAVSISVSVALQILRNREVISIAVTVCVALVSCVVAFALYIHSYMLNKYFLRNSYVINLNKKFQLRENIQVCMSLLPSQILTAVVGIILTLMLIAAMVLNINVPSVVIVGLFQCVMCTYFIVCPVTIIISIKKYRQRVLLLLRRRYSKVMQQSFKQPAEEERKMYFIQLQQQWN